MDGKRHQLVKELFHRVVELGAAERERVLAAACRGDRDLRREVEELLAHAEGRTGDALDRALAERRTEDSAMSPPPRELDAAHGRFLPGAMLGQRYRIVGLLGKGGMGEVYRADDLELGQSVALKFLPDAVAGNVRALERFRREVRVAREIAHPNVCRVYDIAEQDGHVFLSMEFVDGDDLAHVLRRLGRPSPEKAIDIAKQLCLGVAAAHERGVLHRDLKPANVMLDGRGRVRITDFGLAGLATDLANTSERAGTPAYMAPEQLADGEVTVRSDIYSLGLLLYEVVTGRPAFAGGSLQEVLQARSSGSITSISEILTDIDPAVERVIDRCLQNGPGDRPASVYAVLGALPGGDPLAAALAAGETPSPELVANAVERGGMRPVAALAALAAVVVLSLFIAFANETKTFFPGRPPHELSLLAEQHLERFGLTIPNIGTESLDIDPRMLDWKSGGVPSRVELEDAPWPPPYLYWRRWSPRPARQADLHSSATVLLSDPPRTTPEEVSVVLDANTGRLIELLAVPEAQRSESVGTMSDTEWQTLLTAAGIDPDDAAPSSAPLPEVPVSCTAVRVWEIEQPAHGPLLAAVATFDRRPIWFRLYAASTVDGSDSPTPGSENAPESPRQAALALFFSFFLFATASIAFVAWRNMKMGRGDRHNALRCALFVAAATILIDLL